jgi:hypothetical protein
MKLGILKSELVGCSFVGATYVLIIDIQFTDRQNVDILIADTIMYADIWWHEN